MPYPMRLFNRILATIAVASAGLFTMFMAVAQVSSGAPEFVPAQPSSADTVFLKIPRTCSNSNYLNPGYRVSTLNGRISVNIFLVSPEPSCPIASPPLPPLPPLLVEIGRLPAGIYTVDVNEGRVSTLDVVIALIASNLQLTVTDHRATKAAPGVRINYSDHWWDPTNPGSGLFIWQDAQDQLLAGWFTYGADGKAAWYTIQSGSWTTATRYEGRLVQTSHSPPAVPGGGLIDANGPTATQFVGTASLDFSGDEGTLAGLFSYQFDNSITKTRNIRRFNK